MIEAGGEQSAHLMGQFERCRMTKLEGRGVIKSRDLSTHRLVDFATVVAQATAPQAGEAIKNLAAAIVGVPGTLRRHDNAGILLVLAMAALFLVMQRLVSDSVRIVTDEKAQDAALDASRV